MKSQPRYRNLVPLALIFFGGGLGSGCMALGLVAVPLGGQAINDLARKSEEAKEWVNIPGLIADLQPALPPAHPSTPAETRLRVTGGYRGVVVDATGAFPPEATDSFSAVARAGYNKWQAARMELNIYDDRSGTPVLARKVVFDVVEELTRVLRPLVPPKANPKTYDWQTLQVSTELPKVSMIYVTAFSGFDAATTKTFLDAVRGFDQQLPEKLRMRVRIYNDAQGGTNWFSEVVGKYDSPKPR